MKIIYKNKKYSVLDFMDYLSAYDWRISLIVANKQWCCQVNKGSFGGSRVGDSAKMAVQRAINDLIKENKDD